jgi:hypothetical protein
MVCGTNATSALRVTAWLSRTMPWTVTARLTRMAPTFCACSSGLAKLVVVRVSDGSLGTTSSTISNGRSNLSRTQKPSC